MAAGDRFDQSHLVVGVEVHHGSGQQGSLQVVLTLVGAVENDSPRIDADPQRHLVLHGGDDLSVAAQPVHLPAQSGNVVGLVGIGDQASWIDGSEGVEKFVVVRAERLDVEQEECFPEIALKVMQRLPRQLHPSSPTSYSRRPSYLVLARLWLLLGRRPDEVRHRRVSLLADAIAAERLPDGQGNDLQVEPERRVVDIPDVQLELFFPAQRVAAVYLSPAGDPRAHVVPTRLLGRVERQVFHQKGPRSDETHVPAEHVPEFRQLVQARRAQNLSQARQALRVWQGSTLGVGRLAHGAELDKPERDAVATGPQLGEQNRPPKVDAHRAGDREHRHCQDRERHGGGDGVERALHQASLMACRITRLTMRTSYFSSAIRRLSRPIAEINPGSSTKRAIAWASAPASLTGTRQPFTSCRTVSRQPGASVVTIGRPMAIASKTVRGVPSRYDGST